MLRLLTCLALLTTCLAAATAVPDVPAVRFDLLPGGKVNVVVGTRTYPMEAAKAAELRQALEAMDLPGIRADIMAVLGVENSVRSRRSYGGTAPDQVRAQVARWKGLLGLA